MAVLMAVVKVVMKVEELDELKADLMAALLVDLWVVCLVY